MSPRPYLARESGFTISELLVVMGITLVMALAGWSFYATQLRSLTDQSGQLDAVEGARAALDFMAEEIRTAGTDPSLAWGGAPLTVATGTSITLQRDLTGSSNVPDGAIQADAVDPSAELIAYSYDSANQQIVRTVNAVALPLIRNVPNGGLSLTYLNADGSAAATATAAAVVLIQVQVNAARSTTPRIITLSARSTLRNRVLAQM